MLSGGPSILSALTGLKITEVRSHTSKSYSIDIRCLKYIISLSAPNLHYEIGTITIVFFLKKGKRGSERLGNLLKSTQLSGRAKGFKPRH